VRLRRVVHCQGVLVKKMTEQPQDPLPSKGTAVSFGERMRREREMRGIKLEEIAESTKIGKRNLVALEQEQFDQLPGGIFNKGFVRAYAKYLGLDEEQTVNDFLAASANYDQPAALQPPPTSWVKPPAMPSDEALRRRSRLWALLAAFLLVGGFIGWFYWKNHQRAEAADQPQAPQSATDNSATIKSDPAQASSHPEDSPLAAGNLTPSTSHASTTSKTASAPAKGGPFTVKIQAKEDSWVGVTSDGKQVMDIVIPAGQERTIHARQELVLRTGNAGGIEVAHNGIAIPTFGQAGEVKTLTFNARGLQH
jgi:cytoskeleton protein RodZ